LHNHRRILLGFPTRLLRRVNLGKKFFNFLYNFLLFGEWWEGDFEIVKYPEI
jgi:hypothetical protein